ncbi:MAG: hypothetical protein U0411_11270 [Thermodesulfovibrionales bacterium]
MRERDRYIEYKVLPPFWGWLVLIALTAALLGFGVWAHHIIPDRPRQWNYGSLPDIPAESVYSTLMPQKEKGRMQVIAPLPEARPLAAHQPPPGGMKEAGERQGKSAEEEE